ncbi:MAG TPA: hypothetical protein VLM20_04270 [Methylophilaceae bacterium]|nr:hypothetical protein [Methylophilaceae bacterium]
MKRFNLILIEAGLIACLATACVNVNKAKQNLVTFDFGLFSPDDNQQSITSKIFWEKPSAIEALEHHKIRYRLNYLNPSRVYFYTESRWATTPSDLLSSRASQLIKFTRITGNCTLKLKIEAFDHVFHTSQNSDGVVQLNALILDKRSHRPVARELFTKSFASASSDAKGGVAALKLASDTALREVVDWSNSVFKMNEVCQ